MSASVWQAGAAISANNSVRFQPFVATSGQTLFEIPPEAFAYVPGTSSLLVFQSSGAQRPGIDFVETSSSSFTMTTPVAEGTIVLAMAFVQVTATLDALQLRADLANAADPSKGAALVSFKQEGTGSIVRTLLDKMFESVSFRDFGAVGTFIVDDTLAFAAAIAKLGSPGGVIQLPPGNYKVSQSLGFSLLSFAVPVIIKGHAAYATTITFTHSGKLFDARTSGYQALCLEDLRIVGPGKTSVGSMAIDMAMAYGYLKNVSIGSCEVGWDLEGSNFAYIAGGLNIINCGEGLKGVNAAPSANILVMDGRNWISYCDKAVHIEQFGTFKADALYVEQNGTSLDIRSTGFVCINDIYSEAESVYSLYGYDIYPIINNCRFVTHEPYYEFSAPPPLYGITRTDGLRLGRTVDWYYNYNTGTKHYDVAYTDFIYGGVKYRCLGQSTSTGDAYEKVNSSGQLNYPKQPLAIATMTGATTNDKTGDGTLYTVLFDSETVDQSASYDPGTGIFTAPVAGKYQINATISLANLGAGHNFAQMAVVVGATNYYTEINPGAVRTSANRCTQTISLSVNVSASAQIKVTIAVLGSTKTVGIGNYSYFDVTLVA